MVSERQGTKPETPQGSVKAARVCMRAFGHTHWRVESSDGANCGRYSGVQIQASGRVSEAAADSGAPFAVVTWFDPGTDVSIESVSSLKDLEERCDEFRRSGNLFYAFRLDGRFRRVHTRAPRPPEPGIGFVEASKAQSEFALTDTQGTLVGLWSPGFSSAFSVAGYHFHFLSADRHHGGHLLDVEADALQVKVEALTSFHLALPESEAFLKADLSRNTAEELAYAERTH